MAPPTKAQAAAYEAAQEMAITLALEREDDGSPSLTLAEIGDQVGYSAQAIGNWLGEARRAGIEIPPLRARPDPNRKEARRLWDAGHSLPEIAAALGVSAETARRYVENLRRTPGGGLTTSPPPIAPPTQPPGPPPELAAIPDDPAEEGISTLVSTKRLQVAMLRAAQAAERDGMHAVAQRFYRDATNLSGTITRLEGMAAAEKDGIHVTQAEIDQAWARVETAILAITDRPLVCSECSRNLSISWAGRDSLEP